MDPVSDALYGSGYMTPRSVRYSWVLGLKERIPIEELEEKTDQYWRLMKSQGFCAVASIVH